MQWTRFVSPRAERAWREDMSWPEFLDHVRGAGPYPDKAHCPWAKFALFGETPTSRGSLRHDANVLAITGLLGDYDAEKMTPDEALARLERHQIKAAVYTSPSHWPDRPRWRVAAPFSRELPPTEHYRLMARLNGALGGVLAAESFTLSQSYYYGHIRGRSADYRVLATFEDPEDGFYVDELDELDDIAIGTSHSDAPDFAESPIEIEKPTAHQWSVLKAQPRFAETWDMNRPDLPDQSGSSFDLALANMAVEADWPDACIVYLLLKWRNTHNLSTSKLQRPSYIARTLAKARAKTRSFDDSFVKPSTGRPVDTDNPLAWIEDFTLSDAEAEKLSAPEWAYEDLVISGHVVVICGESGVGKTTIMMYVSAELSRAGYRVVYVNADTSGGDAKELKLYADACGFQLLLPDLKVGLSMTDVIGHLQSMAEASVDLADTVFVFDTLKKMTDVISKTKSKELYKLFRRLSGMQATIVCNAHTNKYKGDDGQPIYEGTGDLRSDVDELIYLIGDKREDGSILVSTLPDKTRGKFKPITFCIGADRLVSRHDFVDVLNDKRRVKQQDDDADIIEVITDFLGGGQHSQTEVVEHCHKHKIGRRTVRRVLRQYGGSDSVPRLWLTEKGFQKNAWYYRLPDPE